MSTTKVFYNPTKIILGKDSIEQLPVQIKQAGLKKILCVYGSGSAKTNGVADRVSKSLKENEIDFMELWGVQPNPLISKVREGVAICKNADNHIEGILAIGGGSVIDTGKAIAAGALMENDVYDFYIKKCPKPTKMLPVFAVVTLSATGSEFNDGSVVSDPSQRLKICVYYDTTPVCSAIDPSVQMGLPWRQVMCGAVDAMSHLMESMFDFDDLGITTRNINFALQKSVLKCMEIMVDKPQDYNARENFCWAASLALNGLPHFGHAGDWNVHGIEKALSAYDDKIAHGEGLAVISRQYYPLMYRKGICKTQLELWSKEIMGEEDPEKGFAKYTELLKQWKAPLTLGDFGIVDEKQVDTLTEIFEAHMPFGTSKVYPIGTKECKEILMACLPPKSE